MSLRKSTGYVLFARMPPTFAAASTTYLGLISRQEREDRVAVLQIQLGRGLADEVREARGLQLAPDRRPDESAMAGDVEGRVAVERAGRVGDLVAIVDGASCGFVQLGRLTLSIQGVPARAERFDVGVDHEPGQLAAVDGRPSSRASRAAFDASPMRASTSVGRR